MIKLHTNIWEVDKVMQKTILLIPKYFYYKKKKIKKKGEKC